MADQQTPTVRELCSLWTHCTNPATVRAQLFGADGKPSGTSISACASCFDGWASENERGGRTAKKTPIAAGASK